MTSTTIRHHVKRPLSRKAKMVAAKLDITLQEFTERALKVAIEHPQMIVAAACGHDHNHSDKNSA